MRCLNCGNLSFFALCKLCEESIVLKPKIRDLGDFKVYSFYTFSEMDSLMYAKYKVVGSKIYRILAKKAADYLRDSLKSPLNAYGIGIDDKVQKNGYAHNGIFLYALKKVGIKPIFGALHAKNNVSYAGKNLEFREKNPRNFALQIQCKNKEIFLVDDIITTGLTLKEAKKYLEQFGNKILGAFVLCDAKD